MPVKGNPLAIRAATSGAEERAAPSARTHVANGARRPPAIYFRGQLLGAGHAAKCITRAAKCSGAAIGVAAKSQARASSFPRNGLDMNQDNQDEPTHINHGDSLRNDEIGPC